MRVVFCHRNRSSVLPMSNLQMARAKVAVTTAQCFFNTTTKLEHPALLQGPSHIPSSSPSRSTLCSDLLSIFGPVNIHIWPLLLARKQVI